MSPLKTIKIAHLPDDLLVHIALYDNVKNAAFLQQQLLDGNSAFEYAFLDASVILSSTHLLAAVFRAAINWTSGRLKSNNVHAEIVFCFSMNNNIAESFRRFGISSTTTTLYAIKLSTTPSINAATVEQHLSESIQGILLPFEDAEIARFTDITKVRKIYKLSNTGRGKSNSTIRGGKSGIQENGKAGGMENGREEDLKERKELDIMVVGLMALRGAA